MTDLNCSVENCAYNKKKEGLCGLESIHVGESDATVSSSTDCRSFKEAREAVKGKCCGDRDLEEARLTTDIECEADNCVYNCGKNCSAEHIQVSGNKAESCFDTQCETFCLK